MPVIAPQGSFGFTNVVLSNLNVGGDEIFCRAVGSIDTSGLAAEQIPLVGGASFFAYAAAPGRPDSTISMTLREPTNRFLTFFSPVLSNSYSESNTPTATASVVSVANTKGTSMISATGGIATVGIATGGDNIVAFGTYRITAVTTSTFNVYIDNLLQPDKITIQGGTDGLTPIVNPAPLTRGVAASTVDFNGIRFTAGSGTAAFVVGDTAVFTVLPPNNFNSTLTSGVIGSTSKVFSLFASTDPVQNGVYRTMYFPKCVASGSPVPSLTEKEWVEYEVSITVLDNGSAGAVVGREFNRSV